MGRVVGLGASRIARVAALGVACIALTACSSSSTKFAGLGSGKNSKYSPKVVADGEPVPKGGGTNKVGAPYTINGKTYYPSDSPSYRSEGIASWYGADFHGRLTANGEVYDMHSLSAAHPTMPLPSYARVTNLDNGRSIVVRVNDRGPYARNRVIDLSIGTAKALDAYHKGLARVRVEYVGRASLEGSDDRMLMATLRHNGPAPAPSRVMVASARPFVPDFGEASAREPGLRAPPERPFALGAATERVPTRPATTASASVEPPARASAAPATSASAYAPVRNDGSAGLMSGRGLY